MPQDTRSPCSERPRERLLRHGAQALTSAELLAVLLRTGTRGRSAVDMGRRMIEHFGGLRRLLAAESSALLAFPGMGAAKTCELLAVQEPTGSSGSAPCAWRTCGWNTASSCSWTVSCN